MLLDELINILQERGIKLCFSSEQARSVKLVSVTADSRRIGGGSGFFAIPGAVANGLDFVEQAVQSGAVVSFVPEEAAKGLSQKFADRGCVFVGVSNIRLAFALAAQAIAANPSEELITVGITGTNGKTSVSWIISEALSILKGSAGYIGTLGVREMVVENGAAKASFSEKTNTTTPDPVFLSTTLRRFVDRGASAAAIEVSSHALDQYRSSGINWDAAVITNITRDHLDYHPTFDDYIAAKKKLFTRDLLDNSKTPFAVLNQDDPLIRSWIEPLGSEVDYPVYTFSTEQNSGADGILRELTLNTSASLLKIEISGEMVVVHSRLIGRYNALNTLAAAVVLGKLGFTAADVSSSLSAVSPVPGRMQPVGTERNPVFVDYAHTPDAIRSVVSSLREIHSGPITTIFGCGGDRDRGKRPLMAKVAAELSDKVILTSDNPRSEDPQQIVNDAAAGFAVGTNYTAIVDRREAIHYAISQQQPDELIVIAGKGHEDYQEIKGVKHHFLDEEVAREAISL